MSIVHVTLSRHHKSWDLPRQQILNLIPESLIGQALEEEPDVPEIILENPDVTPEAMQVIAEYLEGREPTHHIPSLVAAARYLNMLWLNYYVDPMYDQVEKPILPEETYDTPKNRELMIDATQNHHNAILEYLLRKGVSPLFITASYDISSDALHASIAVDNLAAFQMLLTHSILRQEYSDNTLLLTIFSIAYRDKLNRIEDYMIRNTPTSELFAFMKAEHLYGFVSNLEILQRIYALAETSEQKDILIFLALEARQDDALWWLLQQPENNNYRSYLEIAMNRIYNADLLNYLLGQVNLTPEELQKLLTLAVRHRNGFAAEIIRQYIKVIN